MAWDERGNTHKIKQASKRLPV